MTARSKPAARQQGTADAPHAAAVDEVLEQWQLGVAKESLRDELIASNALLRGAQALREMQIEAARRTQQAHAQAVEQAGAARSVSELSRVAMELAQTDAEAALRYWSDWTAIAVRTGLDGWSDALGAMARAQALGQEALQRWGAIAAASQPQALQPQLEHLSAPLTASPLIWPAQEALREMVSLGARPWWWAASPPDAAAARH